MYSLNVQIMIFLNKSCTKTIIIFTFSLYLSLKVHSDCAKRDKIKEADQKS